MIDRDDQLQLFKLLRGRKAGDGMPPAGTLCDMYSYARNTGMTLEDTLQNHHTQYYADVTKTVTQTGNDNIATAGQNGSHLMATIVQTGNFNNTEIEITGIFSSGRIWRDGIRNRADLLQEDGRYQFATIEQLGNGNVVNATQDGFFNTLDIDQQGDRSEVLLSQTGFHNTAKIEQLSNRNYAEVSQTLPPGVAASNMATIRQEVVLPSNTFVTQSGQGNMTSIAQR